MKCVICKHGETRPGTVTAAFDLPGGGAVVFQDVPAKVCDTCGERYFDEETTGRLLREARRVKSEGKSVKVLPFAA